MNSANSAIIILLLIFFMSCQRGAENAQHKATEKIAESTTEEIAESAAEENSPEEAVEDPVVIEDYNSILYHKAKAKWDAKNELALPDNLALKELYDTIGPCDFNAILNFSKSYVLTHFSTGTDVENNFFVTFNMNGDLIDTNLYGTRAYGSDFTTTFVSDNFISVKNFNQHGFRLDESGDDTFDYLEVDGEFIYIKKNGRIQSIKSSNEAFPRSEISPELFDYYQQEIKAQFDAGCNLYPFTMIPGNNTLSTSDVYESLEGGGLYSSCLEIRNAAQTLIGIIGYTYDPALDSIPNTYTLLYNKAQKPVVNYNIIGIEGDLYLELITADTVVDKTVQIIKEYYSYPKKDRNARVQSPIHSITGNLEALLDTPLSQEDMEKLQHRSVNKE